VEFVSSIMHHHLFATKVCVPKWWSDIDDRLWPKDRRDLIIGQYSLQERQSQSEKAGIRWGNDQRIQPQVWMTSHIAEHRQGLRLEPGKSLLTQWSKVSSIALPEGRLVGGLLVGDNHAVRVTSAHIGLRAIDTHPIANACHGCLQDPSPAIHLIRDLKAIAVRPATREVDQLFNVTRDDELRACSQNARRLCREIVLGQSMCLSRILALFLIITSLPHLYHLSSPGRSGS